METVILGGGGDEVAALQSHTTFYNLLGKRKLILYIPLALDSREHSWDSCMQWFANAFKEIGTVNINLITELNGLTTDFLKQYDGVYIGGGNTFKLLKIMKESGFSEVLSEFSKAGGIIYGGSAGAIILGNDISTARHADPNDVNLKIFEGLNLVKGYSIWPHYEESLDNFIFEWAKSNNEKVVALAEDSALVVSDDKLSAIGSNVIIFDSASKTRLDNQLT